MIYKKPKWAVKQMVRESGLVEDICKHGVGHPNKDWLKKHDPNGKYKFSQCQGSTKIEKTMLKFIY